MTLALRYTTFDDGERRPDDYEVRYAGRTVGPGREPWRWMRSGLAQASHGPNGGVADCLDEAKAAWERGP